MSKRRKPENSFPTMGDEDYEIVDIETMGDGPEETTEQDRYTAQVLGVFQPNEDFDRAREKANEELIQILAQFLTDHPTQRFGQALKNLELATDDVSMVEPQVQLKRAKHALKRIKR